MTEFTHIDEAGRARMVDVSEKAVTDRTAIAECRIFMNTDTFDRITENRVKKGAVLETARISGIMAAKKTADLIPMCHPIAIRHVSIDFFPERKSRCIRIVSLVRATDKTGVEMEALTAASVSGLTIYDMCKSYDRAMTITDLRLVEKSGGKSGHFVREAQSSGTGDSPSGKDIP